MRSENQAVLWRLRTVEGHLHAVSHMLQNDLPCPQIIHQLNAIRCALQATEIEVIRPEIERCIQLLQESPDPDQRMSEITHLSYIYHFIVNKYRDDPKDQSR